TGHIFFESHFSQFSADIWGMHGGFSDGAEFGDVFTSNDEGLGGSDWIQGGGFPTTAMRVIGNRWEENKVELRCDPCSGNHLDGAEFQFQSNNAIVLNGQWDYFWMTGGFIEQHPFPGEGYPVLLSGNGNFGHPAASFTNVLITAIPHFIDYEVSNAF